MSLRSYRQRFEIMRVREQHPLQQGLRRHLNPLYSQSSRQGQRTASITTRIETRLLIAFCCHLCSQRTASITTRIETSYPKKGSPEGLPVREQHPLQQGLRQHKHGLFIARSLCQRTASITTRIETCCFTWSNSHQVTVREQHPLQQGLRQYFVVTAMSKYSRVREQHPLQQGLRLNFL